jgi:hypothetical protein
MSQVKLDIEKLIQRLLHHYECVILPDFGGFIIRDSPCGFNVAKDKLKPYGKHIFFNPHLLQNDGLLYKEIQSSYQMTYQDAIAAYQSWLSDTRQVIMDAGSRSFGQLGTFYKGNENNVWFSPFSSLNLAIDSYGLFPVDVKMVAKASSNVPVTEEKLEILQEDSIPSLADNKPIETFKPHRINYKAWLTAASVALLVHIAYLNFEKSDVTVNEASILPVIEHRTDPADSMEIADSASRDENKKEDITQENIQPESEVIQENVVMEETPEKKAPEAEKESSTKNTIVEPQPETPQKENTVIETPVPPATEKTFTRIAKYRLESNANFHQKDLVKKGVEAIVRQNGDWFEVLTEGPVQ